MKRFNYLFLCFLCFAFLCSCSCPIQKNDNDNSVDMNDESVISSEIRAVWISYNELSMKSVGGGDESQFSDKVGLMFSQISADGFNRVIVQVRPFSDAFYDSAYFPPSEYLTGRQGITPGYDALKIMVEAAHSAGLKIDAWINPYRVSYKTDFSLLSDDNPAKKWYIDNPETENLFILPDGIFYNPASYEVQKLIIDGVREIVTNYDVDGIHLDDYFYPSTSESIDSESYLAYRALGGKLSLGDWRRENVSSLMGELHSVVQSLKPNAVLSVSPMADIKKDYNNCYADIPLWCSESGYIDIIMPQIYFGFDNSSKPFSKTAEEWESIIKTDSVKLCVGLAIYKSGREDGNAGEGKSEWIDNTDICSRQLKFSRSLESYCGFALYSYSYIFGENSTENSKNELQNILPMLY